MKPKVQNTFMGGGCRGHGKPIFMEKLAGFGLRVNRCGKGVVCFRHTLPSAQAPIFQKEGDQASNVGTRAPLASSSWPRPSGDFFLFLRYS